ncbi:zinc finger CCCH-type antiviral protein 1 isoform X2 [Parambassis ranga]|uniref:Zinc finger CCCH-type antiviral protein 1 isoform X2 n=1 Tax=Parambassis ranga TaxID=210632 RepID=A0A6P7HX31_9TELE|nr:zinc finger CCCH-type antiviral protein 1-like isoform X2 [Parambassis ranga]
MATAKSHVSDVSEDSDSDKYSDTQDAAQVPKKEPCRYYNKAGCKRGGKCEYWHVCKYALQSNCRYGINCKLNHNINGSLNPGADGKHGNRWKPGVPKLTDGRHYQWQLNDGKGWKDIDNDHILEAQYTLPNNKSIKLYNTKYGGVSIDFNRMRVYEKNMRVRRLDDGNTVWNWYCSLSRKWVKYGVKDSKGNPAPVQSYEIERMYQSNPTGSMTFQIGSNFYEIHFKEMQQVGQRKERKVTRRPTYYQKHQGAFLLAVQNLSLNQRPQWQYEGDKGKWHEYKRGPGGCSVSSDDIERSYMQTPSGDMDFTVGTNMYKLDFQAMMQINLHNQGQRNVRRKMV